ncbi:MAG: hypothetical protein COT74_03535 [Bdellovibrionales bacterium CG10_big_fil_rev_8_21_14_0_10_45_34]|nr:MAG: hypothetical protein COT74_03535 [Bdellovibrionales bacterium CG10_big_fil_rev_8_21_14_0_10_45_34]
MRYLFNRIAPLFLVCLFLSGSLVQAEPLKYQIREFDLESGSFEFGLENTYSESRANYNGNGEIINLPAAQRLQHNRSRLTVKSQILDQISLLGGVSGGYTSSVGTDNFGVRNDFERTRFGVSDVELGSIFQITRDFIDLDASLIATIPLTSVNYNQTDPLIHDGAFELEGGLSLRQPLGWLTLLGYVGINYRSQGLSTQLPWNFDFRAHVKKFYIQMGLSGETTLVEDNEAKNQTPRLVFLQRVNGGSQYFNAFSPTIVNLQAQVGAQFDDSAEVYLGLAQAIYGLRSAVSWQITGGLVFNFGGTVQSRSKWDTDSLDDADDSFGDSEKGQFRPDSEVRERQIQSVIPQKKKRP